MELLAITDLRPWTTFPQLHIWRALSTPGECLLERPQVETSWTKDRKISGLRENCCKFRTFYRASFCFIITNEWTFFPSAWERRQEGGHSIRLGQDQDRAMGTQRRQVGSRIQSWLVLVLEKQLIVLLTWNKNNWKCSIARKIKHKWLFSIFNCDKWVLT